MTRLLVVTPTLGKSPWLGETVASVASLRLDLVHVLVAPAAAMEELGKRFRGTTVLADPGGGMYAAINAGAAAVRDWETFTYINDDDLLLANFSGAVRVAERAGKVPLIAYGRVRLIDGRGQRLGEIPVAPSPKLMRALYAEKIEPVFQHGMVVTRAAWHALGGFDAALRLCGDSELLARACVQGIPMVRVAGAEVAAFRLHSGQLTRNRAAMQAERQRVNDKLGLLSLPRPLHRTCARVIFRLMNARVYAERIARHGWSSFDDLVARAK